MSHAPSTGQFGAARIEQTATFACGAQCAEALVNYFQDALVNENSCSFGAELAAKRQFSYNNRSAKRLSRYRGAAKQRTAQQRPWCWNKSGRIYMYYM